MCGCCARRGWPPGCSTWNAGSATCPGGTSSPGWATPPGWTTTPLRGPLAWARDRGVRLSAFLEGPRGIAGRGMQAAWGGSFTYAQPDDAPALAPGQLALGRMRAWRCHKLHAGFGLCGVLGLPVLHSRGPRVPQSPLPARLQGPPVPAPGMRRRRRGGGPPWTGWDLLGASLTAPLKETVPPRLGLEAPLNTLYRRAPGAGWRGANNRPQRPGRDPGHPGPGTGAGAGGRRGWRPPPARPWSIGAGPACWLPRRAPVAPEAVRALAPAGVVQATRLGMEPGDPAPFPDLLEGRRTRGPLGGGMDLQGGHRLRRLGPDRGPAPGVRRRPVRGPGRRPVGPVRAGMRRIMGPCACSWWRTRTASGACWCRPWGMPGRSPPWPTRAPALAALDEGPYGILVTDLRLPGMSGLDLLKAAKRRQPALRARC